MCNLLEQVVQPQGNSTTTFIYGLVDPRTGYVRYVGKANKPDFRLRNHLCPKSLQSITHKACWMKGLVVCGLKPELIILEKVQISEWKNKEKEWIAYYRSIPNYPTLTNIADGGEGVEGYILTEEQRKKRSIISKGRRHSDDAKAKISVAHKGREHTNEARANMSRGRQEWWKALPKEEQKKQMDALHSHRKRHGKNNSRFIGVTHVENKYWKAEAFANGKRHYIGQFKIEDEAARARDRFVLKHIGESVTLNFPRSEYGADIEEEIMNSKRSNRLPLARNNTSGYKGVYLSNQSLRWTASIFYKGKNVAIGTFGDRTEAAKAYDRKVIELLDPLAYTNFPRSSYP